MNLNEFDWRNWLKLNLLDANINTKIASMIDAIIDARLYLKILFKITSCESSAMLINVNCINGMKEILWKKS